MSKMKTFLKGKLKTAAITALAAAVMVTGGLCWQYMSGNILKAGAAENPGGRLHYDQKKDVGPIIYAENYGADKIYVRIKLTPEVKVDGTKVDDPYRYITLTKGGKTTYLPTVNKDNASSEADVNGTFNGKDGKVTNDPGDDRYSDYKEYTAGTEYDGRTAKDTEEATAMSMADWQNAGSNQGTYWVEDTDGWYYYANPLTAGTATGTLVNGVGYTTEANGKKVEYTLKAEAQFITADDAGIENNTGFWKDGEKPTLEAQKLLSKIGVTLADKVTVSGIGDNVETGKTYDLSAETTRNGNNANVEQNVTWSIKDAAPEGVSLEGNKLKVGANALQGAEITVQATSKTYGIVGEKTVTVDKLTVGITSDGNAVQGKTYTLTGTVKKNEETIADGVNLTWSISGAASGTTIDSSTGVITVASDQTETLKVKATLDGYTGIYAEKEIVVDEVVLTVSPASATVRKGATQTFEAKVKVGTGEAQTADVTWSVSGGSSTNTAINDAGKLNVGADETATNLTVTAALKGYDGKSVTATVAAKAPIPTALAPIENIEPGTTETVTIDGMKWYVLAKTPENDKALIFAEKSITPNPRSFGGTNKWKDANIRTYLKEWLKNKETLAKYAVETQIKTRSEYNTAATVDTTDKVFLLSEADVFGTGNGDSALASDYTYNGEKLLKNDIRKNRNYSYLLRSPSWDGMSLAIVNDQGINAWAESYTSSAVVPALWISLEEK